jgi:alpha-N-arabinofuranosidase
MFSASALATGGYRPDLLQAIADLKPASIRWPGGSFANSYIWQSGIGPAEKRVPHPVEIWNDRDPNQFGTDEFMQFCKLVGADPVIVINTSRGVDDALNWLEYCMGDATTPWGKVRAANGHPQPYELKVIEIDNETWLLMNQARYIQIVKEFVPAIRAKYPRLKISIVGSYGFDDGTGEGRAEWKNAGWDQAMLDNVAPLTDILSVHYYNGLLATDAPDYVNNPRAYEAHLKDIGARIRQSANPGIKIYMSEWNLTHARWGNDWRVGLYAGGILNALERQSDLVIMSCPALFMRRTWATAWNNALINFDQNGWFPAGNYVVMKLFRESYAPQLLAVDGPERPLNMTATRSEDGNTLYLKLVNPEQSAVTAEFALDGSFTPTAAGMQLVAPGGETVKNSMESPDAIKPVAADVTRAGQRITVDLPPLSVGVVKLTR